MTKPLRLVSWEEVMKNYEAAPWTEEQELLLGRELLNCMEWHPHPDGKVTKETIVSVVLVKDDSPRDGWADMSFVWLVRLNDDSNWLIKGEHDSTGWDCQSSAEYELINEKGWD